MYNKRHDIDISGEKHLCIMQKIICAENQH